VVHQRVSGTPRGTQSERLAGDQRDAFHGKQRIVKPAFHAAAAADSRHSRASGDLPSARSARWSHAAIVG
jgi:hypothetical protein